MRFIVDNNVGKLARALRVLGYDTVFVNPIADDELIALAHREGRIILTRDAGILRRRVVTSGAVRAVRVESDDWRAQLGQIVGELGLTSTPRFTRCLECNAPLVPTTREEAQPHVPPYVYHTQPAFLACPACGRHFWPGTHWRHMTDSFGRMLGNAEGRAVTGDA